MRNKWPLFLLIGGSFSFVFQGDGRECFDPQGRNLSEGRIFSIACYDINRDGRPDIIVSDYLNPPRILYNDGDLRFDRIYTISTTTDTATSGHGVALGDFNGDGQQDLFLVYNGFSSRVLFGDQSGKFTDSGRPIGTPDLSGTSVTVADVEGDGDLDAFVTYYQEQARLYVNDGKGLFTMSGQTFGEGVAVGDIDGDKDVDVVNLRADKTALVRLNDKGSFSQEREIEGSKGSAHIELSDLDDDGDLDLIMGGRGKESSLWENDGRGSFRQMTQTFNPGTRIAIGDIDNDGDEDLVVENTVCLNLGGGRFENVQKIPMQKVIALHLIDIDKDGRLDLLGSDLDLSTGKGNLKLFLNRLPRK